MANAPRYANDGITYGINIEPVLDALAAGYAISASMNDTEYLDAIVDVAFDRADAYFNIQAAAYAATGAISHMYEWGTMGINTARTNKRPNPASPVSRLWVSHTEGAGLDRTLWYSFKPSVAHVPKPTTRDTGMSPDIIAKLKDHVFEWKAMVMEEGSPVTIVPNGDFLLIPAYEQNRPYMRPHDIKRGYSLLAWGVTVRPKANAGNFTKYWLDYWNNQGEEIMNTGVNEMILSDYTPEFKEPRTSSTIRPIGSIRVEQEVRARAEKVKKKMQRKARARRVSE